MENVSVRIDADIDAKGTAQTNLPTELRDHFQEWFWVNQKKKKRIIWIKYNPCQISTHFVLYHNIILL